MAKARKQKAKPKKPLFRFCECSWVGFEKDLKKDGECPNCGSEDNFPLRFIECKRCNHLGPQMEFAPEESALDDEPDLCPDKEGEANHEYRCPECACNFVEIKELPFEDAYDKFQKSRSKNRQRAFSRRSSTNRHVHW